MESLREAWEKALIHEGSRRGEGVGELSGADLWLWEARAGSERSRAMAGRMNRDRQRQGKISLCEKPNSDESGFGQGGRRGIFRGIFPQQEGIAKQQKSFSHRG
jgi:hypothetical protein